MLPSQTDSLAGSLQVLSRSLTEQSLSRHLLAITLQRKSWTLLLFSPYNFLLKMVSFYLIFSTAKSDGVFDQPFYDTFSKMSSYTAVFLLFQTVLNPLTNKFISLSLCLSCRLLLVTASALFAQELDLSLPLPKKWSTGDTLPSCFHRIQSVELCRFPLAEVLDDCLWNKLSPWSQRFQAYYFTWFLQ